MISVMNDRLVPRLNAPWPTSTDTFLLANFNRIFWLSDSHLCYGIDYISLVLILISELEDKSRSTSSKTRSLVSLFISDAFEVKKYYSDVDVWTKVLICSSNDGFFK